MSRSHARAVRIQETVKITELLSRLGYYVKADDPSEQQFKWDLHGGHDAKPSARVYPLTNSWFCWGCGKPRDCVSTVQAKYETSFHLACQMLEEWYGLPPLPWEESPEPERQKNIIDEVNNAPMTAEQASVRCRAILEAMTYEKPLSVQVTFRLWGVYDRVMWCVKHQVMEEKAAIDALRAIGHKAAQAASK